MKNIVEDFFKEINSEIQAYLLGFYFGDGSIVMPSEKRIRYDFRVSVQIKDIYILELFQKYICRDTEIKYRTDKESIIRGKIVIPKEKGIISIHNKIFCKNIESQGFTQGKTYKENKLPNISKEYMRHFIRGYFDADGVCITGAYNRNDRKTDTKRVKSTFCITAKKSNILYELQKFLLEELQIDIKVYYENSKDVYHFKTSNQQYLIKLYHYLYDNSEFYLNRKKEKFALVMLTPREFRELKNSEPRNA